MTTETRLDRVEYELKQMGSRLRRLEAEQGLGTAPEPPPSPPPPEYAPPAFRPRVDPERPRPVSVPRATSSVDYEELFGGRVLAWIGGFAILIGIVLFMAMTISRGWLGEEARTVMAALGSFSLLLAGVWLHERKGDQVEAARGAVAAGISGLYGTLLFATQVYDLIPAGSGLIFGALIAGVGMAIAVRWSSTLVAAVGSLGALGMPVLVDMGTSDTSIAFVALALAATAGISIWQRWDWLALGSFVLSAPQLLTWVFVNDGERVGLALAVLVAFWALYVTAAFGYELRTRTEGALPIASLLLLLAGSILVVAAGYLVFDFRDEATAGMLWVFGFSGVHLLLGGAALRFSIHREIGALLVGSGIGLSALGMADAFDGPTLVVAWAVESAVLAYLATRLDATPNPALSSAERVSLAAGGFLALAFCHVLAYEAQPKSMLYGVEDLGVAVIGIAACAIAAFACHHFSRRISSDGARVAAFAGAFAWSTSVRS